MANLADVLPWPKKLKQPRILTPIGPCSIVWYRTRSYRTRSYRTRSYRTRSYRTRSRTYSAQRTATECVFFFALRLRSWSSTSNSVLSTPCFSAVSIFFLPGSTITPHSLVGWHCSWVQLAGCYTGQPRHMLNFEGCMLQIGRVSFF